MLTLSLVLDAAMKVTILLAIAGLASTLMQKQSAAARHAVWSFAVLAALAVLPMELVLPSWRAEILELPVKQVQPVVRVASPAPRVDDIVSERNEQAYSAPVIDASRPVRIETEVSRSVSIPRLSRAQAVFAIWMLGFLAAIAPLMISLVRVRRFARRANRGLSRLWKETLDQLPASALPRRKVTYLESSEASMPLACGIFSPVVIVPGNAERWPAWKRRNILVHELAHVQRFDCLTQALATLLCAIYWFNPLAWVAAARMRIERELACDDRVLEAGSQPVDYADHLLEVARSLRPAAGTAMAAIAMARPSNLSTRLVAVLDSTRSRRGMSRRGTGLLALASLILMLPLAAFKPWKSEVQTAVTKPQVAPLTSKEISTPVANVADLEAPTTDVVLEDEPQTVPVAPISPAGVCVGSKSTSTHIHQNDDGVQKLTLKSSSDGCSLEIVADGKFTFTDDLRDIASLSPGGSLTIRETTGGRVRKIELRSVGGVIQRQYSVNGVSAAFGDAERQWLSEMLLAVERRTAFSAKTRVPRLWENGGIKAVLAEVSLMESSYPKRAYIEALLDVGINFDGPTLAKIIRQIGTEFTSDYERRVILARMPAQKFMNDESWNAFADAVGRMRSDYEKRVILTEGFSSKQRPSPEVAARLLGTAASIKSSYELRVVLTGPALRYATNPIVQPAFVAAARRITSGHELRTALVALVDEIGLAPDAAIGLLEPARGIESDYEKSEIVVAFAKRGVNSAIVNSLLGIAATIRSDYEKRKALTATISSSPRLDTQGLTDALNVARSIGSDYELSSFLKEMIAKYPMRSIPRDPLERALSTISSEHDGNSVRAAMQRAETR